MTLRLRFELCLLALVYSVFSTLPVFAGDCNGNGIDDSVELSADCDGNGVLDECETFIDVDGNGIPDICESDCNANGVTDIIELLLALEADCDENAVLDVCDISLGAPDCDANGVPDNCQADCDGNSIPDVCESDCDSNGTPDVCEILLGEPDCNGNGIPDGCDEASGELGVFSDVGTGLAGEGGFVPDLFSTGCPAVGITFELGVVDGLGGAGGILFISATPASVPFLGGTLLVGSPVIASIPHSLDGVGAGAGTTTFPFTIPAAAVGSVTFYAQAGYVDAGAVSNVSLTDAVAVQLPTI